MPLDLNIHLYADGADLRDMVAARQGGLVKGFTTNPTLMRKAGITDYAAFAKAALEAIPDLPISFEVFADRFDEMERQALEIAGWGPNVFVKIPITDPAGATSLSLIRRLAEKEVKLNLTALLTLDQVRGVAEVLRPDVPAVVSVFAGRIADTGRDPEPMMRAAKALLGGLPLAQLLWASSREVLNIFQAQACGCDIITVTPDILKKVASLHGKDLVELSLDTVRMFDTDAKAAGFRL
ncbi:MAG TPA: transaldolase [Holophagaceae bacterium]|nr:transaldolase [Holophagaceae bacterium]